MTLNKIIETLDDNKLQKQYGYKYKNLREMILSDFKELKFEGEWRIHRASLDPLGFIPIEDWKKGYYDPERNIISISDWALCQASNKIICEIIIHELLHANGYSHGEEMGSEICKKMKYITQVPYKRIAYGIF